MPAAWSGDSALRAPGGASRAGTCALPRFERAAARFAARVVTERSLSPAEAHRVLALAEALPAAPETLTELLRGYCRKQFTADAEP